MRPPLPTMVLLPLGTLLQKGTYRLEKLVRHRGRHLTYEGTHLPSQTPIVIETLNPSNQQPNDIARRRDAFVQHAQAWQHLKHPALAPIREVFIESVLPFVIKDKIAGQSWAMLTQDRSLSEEEAIAKITQIAQGVELAHQHHLWHGDIQPQNVVLPPQTTQPILLQQSPTERPLSSLHAYAAPEVSQGQQTVATDIYGLAATLYTLVTGKIPITASQRQQIRLELHHPGLSQETIVAILRGMAMQPHHRPQSVAKWLALLPKVVMPVSLSTESGNIGAVSPPPVTVQPHPPEETSASEESSLPDSSESASAALSSPASFTSDSEDALTATPSESTVPFQEPSQTVSPTRLQPYSAPPRFPFRALAICSIFSGVVGIAFGLLLRFHYQNQFTNPQVPAKATPVQNEDFLPKPGSTRRQLETLPTPTEAPLESPTPPTLEDPTTNPQFAPGGLESDPTLQEPELLPPDPLATETPNPDLQAPIETYPDSLTPNPNPSQFDPYSTPDFSTPPDTSTDFQ